MRSEKHVKLGGWSCTQTDVLHWVWVQLPVVDLTQIIDMALLKLLAMSLPDLPPLPMHPPQFVFPQRKFGKKNK